MPFQVKRVVKSLSAERAEISFDIRMTFHMPVEETLKCECFVTNTASKIRLSVFCRDGRYFSLFVSPGRASCGLLVGQWVFDTVSAVDKLKLNFSRQPQL